MNNKKKGILSIFIPYLTYVSIVVIINVAVSVIKVPYNSNMHIELSGEFFVRPGFDISEIVPETRSGEWVAVDNQGNSGGIQVATVGALNPDENTSEFTVTKVVDISAAQKRYFDTTNDILGLYIDDGIYIYDRVYLNGRLLHSRTSLEKKQTASMLYAEKSLLHKGENYLTFCMNFNPANMAFELGKLFSGNNIYFNDYKALYDSSKDIGLVLMAGIYLFAGLNFVLVYFNGQRKSYNLWFGIGSVLMAVFTFCKISLLQDTAFVFEVIKYMAGLVGFLFWGSFVEKISSEKISRVTKAVFAVSGAILFIWLFLPFHQNINVIVMVFCVAMVVFYAAHLFLRVIFTGFIREVKVLRGTYGLSGGTAIREVVEDTVVGNLFAGSILIVFILCVEFLFNFDVILDAYLIFVIAASSGLSRTIGKLHEEVRNKNIILSSHNKRLNSMVEERTEKLAEQTRIAVEANKSKSAFLAVMSHEIRTPMNSIIGVAEIELMSGNLTDKLANSLTRIQTSGYGLLGIINDLLDFSKIESGKLEINPIHYDTPSLINDSVQLNIIRIGNKPIKFLIDIDPQLYANLYGDELRLKQILNNILSNAFKYTDEGTVTLGISCKRDGDKVLLILKVSDTGQGMSPENVKMLFEEYSRFNESKNRNTEGTGLGMSITNRLVSMMNGNIDVKSELGVGTVFTVTLEQGYSGDAVIGEELAERLRKFEYTETRRQRANVVYSNMSYGSVLIVDDVETNLFVAEGLMSPYKLKIETAASGFEAVDLVNGGKCYDVIFMDHMMPKMDGIETAVKLRDGGYGKPIVALTANAVAGNDKMFKDNGFDDFISKPIDVRQLNAVLNKFVRDKHKGGIAETAEVTEVETAQVGVSEKLMEVFRRDAAKAVVTLRETVQNGDLLLFAITAHAMKSACANIGEQELSELARRLELAGKNGDVEFIKANTENLVVRLSAFAKTEDSVSEENAEEDIPLLREKLSAIKSAAEEFDDSAVGSILSELKTLKWKSKTLKLFEKIDELLLHSDFDEVGEAIEEWGKSD